MLRLRLSESRAMLALSLPSVSSLDAKHQTINPLHSFSQFCLFSQFAPIATSLSLRCHFVLAIRSRPFQRSRYSLATPSALSIVHYPFARARARGGPSALSIEGIFRACTRGYSSVLRHTMSWPLNIVCFPPLKYYTSTVQAECREARAAFLCRGAAGTRGVIESQYKDTKKY